MVRAVDGIAFEADLGNLCVRPYVAIASGKELDGDSVSVTTGSNTKAKPITSAGLMPPRHRLSVDLDVAAGPGGHASAILDCSGHSGDDARGDQLVNMGLRVAS